jgi:preprotein translocase subunit YajC
MGHVHLIAAAAKSSGSSYYFLIAIIVLFGLMYFVMIRPQRNRQRQVQQAQSRIEPGQQVRTTAGMYATVVEIDDADVVLEIAPGVKVRYLRRAILDVVPSDNGATAAGPGTGEAGATAEDGTATS